MNNNSIPMGSVVMSNPMATPSHGVGEWGSKRGAMGPGAPVMIHMPPASTAYTPKGGAEERKSEEVKAEDKKDAPEVKARCGDGCIAGCCASPHIKAIVWSGLCITLLWMLWSCENGSSGGADDCDQQRRYYNRNRGSCRGMCRFAGTNRWWYWLVFAIAFLIYITECRKSNSRKYLANVKDSEKSATEFINGLKLAKPRINWHVQCYHYETRTRTVYRDGRSYTETYQERVNTHSASMNYEFSRWEDTSGECYGLENHRLTKLTMKKDFGCGDEATETHYESTKTSFKVANDRDTHMDFSTTLYIDGFQKKILAQASADSGICCLNECWFWVWSLLLLTVPYRWYFGAVSGRKTFQIMKTIYR